MREREREREREINLIMREERENNLIFVATCYSELLLLTAHCNKLVKYFKFNNIVVRCFCLFGAIKKLKSYFKSIDVDDEEMGCIRYFTQNSLSLSLSLSLSQPFRHL